MKRYKITGCYTIRPTLGTYFAEQLRPKPIGDGTRAITTAAVNTQLKALTKATDKNMEIKATLNEDGTGLVEALYGTSLDKVSKLKLTPYEPLLDTMAEYGVRSVSTMQHEAGAALIRMTTKTSTLMIILTERGQ